MRMPSRTVGVLFTGLIALAGISRTFAKPPDLPARQTIRCESSAPGTSRAEAESAPPANHALSLEFSLEFSGDETGQITVKSAKFDVDVSCAPLRTLATCVSATLQQCWEAMIHPEDAAITGEEQETAERPMPAAPACSCPYLQQKSTSSKCHPDDELPGSVLQNLAKIELAEEMYKQGLYYRQHGRQIAADFYFRQVHRLCPGSRLDALANAAGRQLGLTGDPEAASEESEEPPVDRAAATGSLHAEADNLVRALMQESRQALKTGHYQDAKELAGCALDLDPCCRQARTLHATANTCGRTHDPACPKP